MRGAYGRRFDHSLVAGHDSVYGSGFRRHTGRCRRFDRGRACQSAARGVEQSSRWAAVAVRHVVSYPRYDTPALGDARTHFQARRVGAAIYSGVGAGVSRLEGGCPERRVYDRVYGGSRLALVHGAVCHVVSVSLRRGVRTTDLDESPWPERETQGTGAEQLTIGGKVATLKPYTGMSGFDRGSGARTASRGASGCLVKQLATA